MSPPSLLRKVRIIYCFLFFPSQLMKNFLIILSLKKKNLPIAIRQLLESHKLIAMLIGRLLCTVRIKI